MESPLVVIIICLCLPLLLFFFFFFFHIILKKNEALLPPGPRGLPIIGNLHQLDSLDFHEQLRQLSKQYGPLFSLKLGLRRAIVVSSPKMVKETLKDHDIEFSGRPNLLAQQKLSYNGSGIGFSQYNASWRELKKICVVHLLSAKRVSSFSSIRQFEIKKMCKKICGHASSSKPINLSEMVMSLTSTMICRIAFGRRYEDEGVERSKFQGLFNELQAMLGAFFISDYIPFLGWIDRLTGLHARLERIYKQMDEFYDEVIDEHMDPNRKTLPGEDLLDILLQLKKQNISSTHITDDHIKAVFMDILVAGTDTTASSTIWAMTGLMKNERVMKKVQQEIRSVGGEKDLLDEEDVQKMSYFKAMIKEVLRLHPPGPLLVPRETIENCTIGGYEIPAKTLVHVNLWAINRDPNAWKDPEEFYPERFLNSDISYHGHDFQLITFGTGRRICPGIHMAVTSLDLILVNLLYLFDWELPIGMKKEDIDTEALPGLTQHKKIPLCLVAKPYT